jgi:hypothetical protein
MAGAAGSSAEAGTFAGVSIFYSYSHKDEELRNELEKHLTILKYSGLIRTWHDRKILPGDSWEAAIEDYFESAEVILLLVSVDFLASDYCRDHEMARALERHRQGTAHVVPIILRPVVWDTTPLRELQVLPKDGRPVTTWPSLDLAFQDVCRGILSAVIAWHQKERIIGIRTPVQLLALFGATKHSKSRVLDAGFPPRVSVGRAAVLLTMVRREDSDGLRAILEIDVRFDMSAEDVQSTAQFRITFPTDANGRLQPINLELKVESPDFTPVAQEKELVIPPRGDSELCAFFLTPQKSGKLLVNLEASTAGQVRSRLLMTTEAVALDVPAMCPPRVQASVQIEEPSSFTGQVSESVVFDTNIHGSTSSYWIDDDEEQFKASLRTVRRGIDSRSLKYFASTLGLSRAELERLQVMLTHHSDEELWNAFRNLRHSATSQARSNDKVYEVHEAHITGPFSFLFGLIALLIKHPLVSAVALFVLAMLIMIASEKC